MKKHAKKQLEQRGIVLGRAQNAPGAAVHADKRRAPRTTDKRRLQREIQHETARTRGPFPFVTRFFRRATP